MSTKSHSQALDDALANIPSKFRSRLIQTYLHLKKGCVEVRCDVAGLAAGKFCEVALRLLQAKVHGKSTPFSASIGNFADECRKLITAPKANGTESERIVIPRALIFLYTLRNKRGVGHVGGDVDANTIDAAAMARVADWITCELIRINHGLSLEEAQDIIDGISVRQLPIVWEVAGKKRVLRDGLTSREQVLLLLYASRDSGVLLEDLCDWTEYANRGRFKSKIIQTLHKDRFLEFDKDTESVFLSPKGVNLVEEKLI